MQQEDEEAGDVVVRVRVESQVHETVHAAVQPDRHSPPRDSRFVDLTQPSSIPTIPSTSEPIRLQVGGELRRGQTILQNRGIKAVS